MAKYKITFKKSVAMDLRKIANPDVKRILRRVDELADDPRGLGCTKLSAQERYRVRVGLYRIIYEIQDTELVVQVVKVGHRSHVYKSA
jgi:mRNA interferase RelE/StbE